MKSFLLGHFDDSIPFQRKENCTSLDFDIEEGTEEVYIESISTFNYPLAIQIYLIGDETDIFLGRYSSPLPYGKEISWTWDLKISLGHQREKYNRTWRPKVEKFAQLHLYITHSRKLDSYTHFYLKAIGLKQGKFEKGGDCFFKFT